MEKLGTLDFSDLRPCELLALGRRALELCGRRFEDIAKVADSTDRPLQELLMKMALDASVQAKAVEEHENQLPEESHLPSRAEQAVRLIRSYLTSLSRSFGEGHLHRDIALFLAESLEEEASRLCQVLAGHLRESQAVRLFSDLSERERGHLHFLREVVLQG